MRKRGRPPHPDILTPRESEVLELLRQDLTNEQIAERLGISLDGAKYHVSEILSKLGVSSREEAAAWQPPVEKVLWRRALALPLIAKTAGLAITAASVAGLGLLSWTVIANEDEPAELAIDPALADLYDRVLAAATREGEVLYSIRNTFYQWPPEEDIAPGEARVSEWDSERWIDGTNGIVRGNGQHGPISVDGYSYNYDSLRGELTRDESIGHCPGSDSVILSSLLSCHLWPDTLDEYPEEFPDPPEPIYHVGPGDLDGVPTILVTLSVSDGTNETVVGRVHIDAQSMLPLRQDWSANEWVTFNHKFISRDSLPDHFLDPAYLNTVFSTEGGVQAEDDPGLIESPVPTPPLKSISGYRLLIDKLGIDAAVSTYGLDENAVPEVPIGYDAAEAVAWYDFSALPGEDGNAVFAAHNTWLGPAIFADLGELEPGDSILIAHDNGTEFEYLVSDVFSIDPDLEESLNVMKPTDGHVITLITCSGAFVPNDDPIHGGEYTERLVVRADLTSVTGDSVTAAGG
jgi:LPXTG-site transpeptidase (sortase) family protein